MGIKCGKCGIVKDESDFARNRQKKEGRSSKCKECHRHYMREEWYPRNREKQRENTKKWKKNNPDKVLAKRYNVSVESIRELLKKSNGKCEICGSAEKLVVDHCHISGKVRGLLCPLCNIGLGSFKDNRSYLSAAMKYLEKTGE